MDALYKRSKYYLSPHFSARHYLFTDINSVVKKFHLKGKLLDIGCGEKPYKSLFTNTDYFGIDFKNYSHYKGTTHTDKPDEYFNKSYQKTGRLPFKNGQFDVVCSFQVLEHTSDPQRLIAEMFRVVKRGGYIFLTFPFVWGLHEEPDDYFRFTHYGIGEMVGKNHGGMVYCKKQGSFFSVVETLSLNYLIEVSHKNILWKLIAYLLYPFFVLLSFISVIMDGLFKSEVVFLNNIVLIKK